MRENLKGLCVIWIEVGERVVYIAQAALGVQIVTGSQPLPKPYGCLGLVLMACALCIFIIFLVSLGLRPLG